MRLKIEYIANYIGIDITNPICLSDIAEIKELDKFTLFMKSNIKNTRLDFLNPLQKLNELKKMFDFEENKERLEKASNEAYKLAEKVREVKPLIKKEIERGKVPHLDELKCEGDNYFSKFEIDTLSKIGDFKKLCLLDDIFKLEDEISKTFSSIVLSTSNRSTLLVQKSTNDTLCDQRVASVLNLALKGN